MGYSKRHKLSDDLREKVGDFFAKTGAVIEEECSYPQPFGNASTLVRSGRLLFRFVWDRGEPIVYVSYAADTAWRPVDQEIIRLTGRDTPFVPLTWEQWSRLLMMNHQLLQQS